MGIAYGFCYGGSCVCEYNNICFYILCVFVQEMSPTEKLPAR